MIKTILKKALDNFNLEISRKKTSNQNADYYHNVEMIEGLERCKQRQLNFKTIIDIGAAAGSWALSAEENWPECQYLLFEPLEERKKELEQLCAKKKNFQFVQAAAGETKGKASFCVTDDLDGSSVADSLSQSKNLRSVDVISIDEKIKELNLPGPYLIKLDTHGFEVPILKGAAETLKQTELLIIEVYGFQISPQCLLFHQLSTYLERLEFRMIDIVDVMRRDKDKAFWQADAFYLKDSHSVFNSNTYL